MARVTTDTAESSKQDWKGVPPNEDWNTVNIMIVVNSCKYICCKKWNMINHDKSNLTTNTLGQFSELLWQCDGCFSSSGWAAWSPFQRSSSKKALCLTPEGPTTLYLLCLDTRCCSWGNIYCKALQQNVKDREGMEIRQDDCRKCWYGHDRSRSRREWSRWGGTVTNAMCRKTFQNCCLKHTRNVLPASPDM